MILLDPKTRVYTRLLAVSAVRVEAAMF